MRKSRTSCILPGGCMVIIIGIIIFLFVVIFQDNSKVLVIDNTPTTVKTYGLFNQNAEKNDKVIYEVSGTNVVLSIVLVETVIAPVYLLGFKLYNPVKVK